MPTRKKRPTRKRTSLIMAASEGDSNMLYATGFFVPDPFIFFEDGGRKTIVMSDLEIDRAKKEASRISNTVAAEKRSRASRATSDGQTESGSDLRHQAIAWAARRLQG